MNKERIKATISLLERMKTENPISNKDGAEICGVYWEVVQNDLERECYAQSSRTKDGSIYILNPGYIDAYMAECKYQLMLIENEEADRELNREQKKVNIRYTRCAYYLSISSLLISLLSLLLRLL